MVRAKTGWYNQKVRHSNAKRFGKAGGVYTSERIKKLLNKPKYKNMTFKQLKNKGVYLSYQGDADKDGVKNIKDCRPLNKKAQDNGLPKSIYANIPDVPEEKPTTEKEEKERIQTQERLQKIGKSISKFGRKIKEKEEQFCKKRAIAEKKRKEKQVSRIEKELETSEYLNKRDRERIADLDLRELNDEELKILAIREGTGFFSNNKYATEIERRIREEAKLETDKTIIINEERLRAKTRIAETTTPKKGFWNDFLK